MSDSKGHAVMFKTNNREVKYTVKCVIEGKKYFIPLHVSKSQFKTKWKGPVYSEPPAGG